MNRYRLVGRVICLVLLATLAACGGGSADSVQQVDPHTVDPAAFVQAAVVGNEFCDAAGLASGNFQRMDGQCFRNSSILGEKPIREALVTPGIPTITGAMFMDWAEAAFPQFFAPAPQPTLTNGGIVFRFYPGTQNFLATVGTDVYVLGLITGNQVVRLGALADFACPVSKACAAPGGPKIDSVSFRPDGGTSIAFSPPTGNAPVDKYTASCTFSELFSGPLVITAGGLSSPIVMPGLKDGTIYKCTVSAENSFGTGPASLPITVAPRQAPKPPTILSVEVSADAIRIAFAPVPGDVVDRYTASCDWSTRNVFTTPEVTGSSATSPVVVSGLRSGQPYGCSVRAHNGWGDGAASLGVTGTPRCCAGGLSCIAPLAPVQWCQP